MRYLTLSPTPMTEFQAPTPRRLIPALFLVSSLIWAAPAQAQDPAPAPPVPTMAEATQLMQSGQYEASAKAFGRIVQSNRDNGAAWFNLGYSLHGLGDLDRALKIHLKAATYPQFKPIALYNVACVHSLKGDADRAFEYLDLAQQAGFVNPVQLKQDSDMDNLRNDPRFAAVLVSMGDVSAVVVEASGVRGEDANIDLGALAPERQFDFMKGKWEIWIDGGKVDGWEVKPTLNGKVWQATGANSITHLVYDASQGVWRASWISDQGHCDTLVGKLEGSEMVMHQKVLRDRPGAIGRWTFSGVRKSNFVSRWMTSEDGGKSWQVEFDMEFRRAVPQKKKAEPEIIW